MNITLSPKGIFEKKTPIFRLAQKFSDKGIEAIKTCNLLQIKDLHATSVYSSYFTKKFSYLINIFIDKNTVKMVSSYNRCGR